MESFSVSPDVAAANSVHNNILQALPMHDRFINKRRRAWQSADSGETGPWWEIDGRTHGDSNASAKGKSADQCSRLWSGRFSLACDSQQGRLEITKVHQSSNPNPGNKYKGNVLFTEKNPQIKFKCNEALCPEEALRFWCGLYIHSQAYCSMWQFQYIWRSAMWPLKNNLLKNRRFLSLHNPKGSFFRVIRLLVIRLRIPSPHPRTQGLTWNVNRAYNNEGRDSSRSHPTERPTEHWGIVGTECLAELLQCNV